MNTPFIPLGPLLADLGLLLVLSLLVERLLMVVNWLLDRLHVVRTLQAHPKSYAIEDRLQDVHLADMESKLLSQEIDSPTKLNSDSSEIGWSPYVEQNGSVHERDTNGTESNGDELSGPSRFDVRYIKPPTDDIKVVKECYLQLMGTIVAVLVCINADFSALSLFDAFPAEVVTPEVETTAAWWEFVLTGIVIGSGSKPIHFLIEFLTNRKFDVTREEVRAESTSGRARPEPTSLSASTVPSTKNGRTSEAVASVFPMRYPRDRGSIEDIVGFEYDGGNRPERLEHTHLRKRTVDLIVYHHTALHADATFGDVVTEFDRKGWLTGYHCVVFKDGTIRVLCRWDRVGNHAHGVNFRSLGVALNGNFETNPGVQQSNYDGRYGIQRPTRVQVKAAAQVTALWTLLHRKDKPSFPVKIDPVFPVSTCSSPTDDLSTVQGIVPHCHVKETACPGSNFPHDLFQDLVRGYADDWSKDPAFLKALNRFSTRLVSAI